MTFSSSGQIVGEELLFQLDVGNIDVQVKTAQQAVAQGNVVSAHYQLGHDSTYSIISHIITSRCSMRLRTRRGANYGLSFIYIWIRTLIFLRINVLVAFLFTENITGQFRATIMAELVRRKWSESFVDMYQAATWLPTSIWRDSTKVKSWPAIKYHRSVLLCSRCSIWTP